MLGKLFGSDSLDFEEIKQRIENTILNLNSAGGAQYVNDTLLSNRHKLGSTFEYEPAPTEVLSWSREELKNQLIKASKG